MSLTKRHVRARVRYWQKVLGLKGWKIAVTFDKDTTDGSEAYCIASPEYRSARLNFDLAHLTDENVDAYVIHEALHPLVWPLANIAQTLAGDDKGKQEWVRTVEESLVTDLEQIILRLSVGPADR